VIPVKSEAPFRLHRSDCAVHNEPTERAGECSCALLDEQDADYRLTVEFHNFPMGASLYVQESWNDGSGHTMTFDRATFDKVCEFAQSFGWNSHSALLAQRDALAKALERIANFRISAFKSYQEDREEIERIARAALAGVTK
jgi:hypothetical protein